MHHLITINKLRHSTKMLNTIQHELDKMNYQLQDRAALNDRNNNGSITSIWILCNKESIMLFNGETPVIKSNQDWGNHFIGAIDKAMNTINSINNGMTSLHKTAVNSYYYRVDSNRLRLILNIEQERDYDRSNYQVYVDRPLYTVSERSLVNNKLAIIIIISHQCNAVVLRQFTDSLIDANRELNNELALRLLVVVMDTSHMTTSVELYKFKDILKKAGRHIAIATMTTSHQLSRTYGIGLAIKRLHSNEIVLLTSINMIFTSSFITRCATFPEHNHRIYTPYSLVRHNELVTNIISRLHSSFRNGYWQYSNDVVCLCVNDLISVIGYDDVTNIGDILSQRQYQVIQGPDEGLEWINRNQDNTDNYDNERVGGLITSYHIAQQLLT